MERPALKPLHWVASARKDLAAMPAAAQKTFGYALHLAQCGGKHAQAKPLHGFGSAGVLEVVESFEGNAWRAVYTVRFPGAVYALHCFQKKSVRGIATPAPDMELIRARYRAAQLHAAQQEGEVQ